MSPIDRLRWERRFVDALPADPRDDRAPRPVHGAAYSRVAPTPVAAPRLVCWVPEVAELLGLARTEALDAILGGNALVPGMEPYAACYGGHQFGHWAGQLGDGRAITLGEVRAQDGDVWELQLKGAGRTPYSRSADGRAVLRSSLRELVASEAMFHLGVPTTRALSLVTTGEAVVRDILYDGNPRPEPGAIVCRVAPSFLRFGNFEIFAARNDLPRLRALFEHTSRVHFGGATPAELLAEVARRTARMIAAWMRVGFVHGVMNTDNMSILGLSIDYGPFGFMEPFDPDWTPNTTDLPGRRYAFANQPAVAQWNLVKLAQALAPLGEELPALERALDAYVDTLEPALHEAMLGKLGLTVDPARVPEDTRLWTSLFALLSEPHEVDMTTFFRALARAPRSGPGRLEALRSALYDAPSPAYEAALGAWLDGYSARAEAHPDAERRARMDAANPAYVPRNYLLHEVIEAAEAGDLSPLERLLDVLRRPYEARAGLERYAEKRPEWARVKAGCSMLSCSS